jgi:FkbM family methyltransferase
LASKAWHHIWNASISKWGDTVIQTNLHGRRALINFANPYPFTLRQYRNYNAPQVEAVLATSEALGRPVRVVDVGAAVGDTALLLLERCKLRIAHLDLIEGDQSFAEILRSNMRQSSATIHEVMLSDRPGPIRSLVRSQHQGTASSEGKETVQATTLDELLVGTAPDVLKVDTDGYDGPILAGAGSLLAEFRPTVLFEWHPKLCRNVGSSDEQGFISLRRAGYDRFIFFTKFGQFSHFGTDSLQELRELCLTSFTLNDWHYDVLALHEKSTLDEVGVADLRYWGSGGW